MATLAFALVSPVVLALPAAAAPAGGGTALSTSVHASPGKGASASASMTYLTIDDLRAVDNRINVFLGPTGRLTLIAPEGLADPDGVGENCTLDNAQPGQLTATQISCAPGFVQLIVGDLGGGNDSFTATLDLTIPIGAVLDGTRRPLAGGTGDDRFVTGAGGDLLDGGADGDSLIGNGGEDLLAGGGGRDNLGGGGGRDGLYGGGGGDRLNGGGARDICNGGPGGDTGKSCDVFQSIP